MDGPSPRSHSIHLPNASEGLGSPRAWQGHKVEGAWVLECLCWRLPAKYIGLILHKPRINSYYIKTLTFLVASFILTNTTLVEYRGRTLGLSWSVLQPQHLAYILTQCVLNCKGLISICGMNDRERNWQAKETDRIGECRHGRVKPIQILRAF